VQINLEGLIPIAAGIIAWMAASGYYQPSKDPGKAEVWRLTYGPRLKKVAPVVIFFGLLQLANVFGDKASPPKREPGVSIRVENLCRELNQNVPYIIDDTTRFDGAAIGPGKKITLMYTLTNMEKSALTDRVKDQIKSDIIQQAASKDSYKIFKEEGISVVILFMFPDAQEALKFTASL